MSKGKGGRPTKYKRDYCAMLISHLKDGLSFESFGGVLGVSKQTLYDWEKATALLAAQEPWW
jgi:DNA-binding transcriptional regulator YiaG